MPLYRKILSHALAFSWQNKYLWFFGLFAAVVGSGGYEIIGQSLSSSSVTIELLDSLMSAGAFNADFFHNLTKVAMEKPLVLLAMFAMFSIIAAAVVFVFWLATVSQAAVVNNYVLFAGDKEHSFQTGLKAGFKYFWKVFFLNVIEKLVILLVLMIVNLPLIFTVFYTKNPFTSGSYVMLFVLFVPLLLVFSLLVKYAISYVVIKNETLAMSLKRSFQLFKDNWIISIEMACLMFVISFIYAVLIMILISAYVLPFSFIVGLAGLSFGPIISLVIIFLLALVGIIFLVASGSFMSILQISAWTDLFVELTGRGAESKVQRLFGSLIKKAR
jgi:hypothetical protein